MARKYSTGAAKKVKRAMHKRKKGTLKSGRSGKKVKSRKQAIGKKVPKKKKTAKKTAKKSTKKSAKKSAKKTSRKTRSSRTKKSRSR